VGTTSGLNVWIREKVLSLPTIEFRFLGPRTHCLVTILTELLQKGKKSVQKKQEKKERWEKLIQVISELMKEESRKKK
jgi:hypothetical protein